MLAAEAALQTIKPGHIATVKKLGKPPHLVMRIMDCVLILMGRPLNKVEQCPDKDFSVRPSWAYAQQLMGDPKFLNKLMEFPKDTINDEMVELMDHYLSSRLQFRGC